MSGVDLLAFLPAATAVRAAPATALWETPAGQRVHLGADTADPGALCRTRTRPLRPVGDVVGRQVCVACARRLPPATRMHLSTLGRPTVAELAAVREAQALQIATECRDRLEALRTEAVLEGSVSERVVFDGDPPSPHDYNGQRTDGVVLTVGLMIGALIPGAMTGGRLWLPGTATSRAHTTTPGGAGVDASFAPRGPLELDRFRGTAGTRYGGGQR